MALRDYFAVDHSARPIQVEAAKTVEAADIVPIQTFSFFYNDLNASQTATREQAMGVPVIARARGIICSTIGSLPLEWYNEASNSYVPSPRVINQPDSRIPGITFKAWIIEDMIFHPFAYARVLKRYADTGRVADMERIAPERVTYTTNFNSTETTAYYIDGKLTAPEDLIIFPSVDDGLLFRAGRTIRAAHQLEKSAYNFALNPIPQTVIKNKIGLTADKLKQMGAAWAKARRESSTAILNGDVDIDTLGYDPKSLQLNEARQYLALELCRAMGLPAWFASADPQSNTYSNAVNQRRDLVDFSLRPYLTAYEERMSFADFTPAGTKVRFDLDDFLRGNPLERAQVYEILNRIGAMSVEEIREEEDLISETERTA